MHIGVDVGGTNTDAVVVDGSRVIAAIKSPTTQDISSGVIKSVSEILAQAGIAPQAIDAVMIGTTQFTNAFVERERLIEVAIVRIALPANAGIRPMLDWPDDLVAAVGDNSYMVHGGYEYDGSEFVPLREQEVQDVARDIRRKGIRNIAISCTFSTINDAMERRTAEIIRSVIPEANVTLSSEIGRLSLIERENAAIMNAALGGLSTRIINSFRHALQSLRLDCPFFISQNDGTLMSAAQVERYPVMTFASGPTNSMRGAGFLTGLADAIVVDVGGTTTDFGVISQRFPRESSVSVDIGGVRTNFRMPDIISIGLGGGSVIREREGQVVIGPDSVGFELLQKAKVFGGDVLTTTDIAVAAGYADIGDPALVADVNPAVVKSAVEAMHRMIEDGIDRMKTSAAPMPVILVGGGAILVERPLCGASEVFVPEHFGLANAIGAAMAQVSGQCDRLFSYVNGRDAAIAEAKREASDRAIAAGAVPETLSIIEVEEVPLAYLGGGTVRVRVKAIGDLAFSAPIPVSINSGATA